MAIYKPTYCYPYGGNVDFCVDPDTKAIYLQCKLNTSNKKVTGYKLVLADGEGNIIWTGGYITPVSSLASTDYGEKRNNDHGAGFNGDTLVIPFVQNINNMTIGGESFSLNPNCLYTNIAASVDYFITSTQTSYDGIKDLNELKDWNNTFDNSYKVGIGEFFVKKNGSNNVYDTYIMSTSGLTTAGVPTAKRISSTPRNFYIRNGSENHNTVWSFSQTSGVKNPNWLFYISEVSSDTVTFNSLNPFIALGSQYSWKIILYQGDIAITTNNNINELIFINVSVPLGDDSTFIYGSYSDEYDINQYDILITQGQILGSTGERLQIYPADVVLQKYYVQLGHVEKNANGIVTDWTPYSTRANIQIYDSTYGHIYPVEGTFSENFLEENSNINGCVVYKYSNNPDEVLDIDKVIAATTTNMKSETKEDIIYHIFNGGLMEIDGVDLKEGDLVLLKDLTGYEYLNGVYSVSASLTGWKRSGSYSEWSQFIGKIILVQQGIQNSWDNFQSQAQAGGVIGSITGSGINAQHPIAGCVILEPEDYFINNPTSFISYYYDSSRSQWAVGHYFNTITDLVNAYKGQYVFMYEYNGTTGSAPLYRYFIPTDAESFSDFKQSTISSEDILAIKELTPYFGFISLSVNGNSWSWNVNNLSSAQKGSELFFIPEQPVTLYPHYENLSVDLALNTIFAVYIGQQIQSSAYILQYNLQTISGTVAVNPSSNIATLQNLSQKLIDGQNLEVGNRFLGIYNYYNFVPNWDNEEPENVVYVVKKPSGVPEVGSSITVYGLCISSSKYVIDNSSYESVNLESLATLPVRTLEYDSDNQNWCFASYGLQYIGGNPYVVRTGESIISDNSNILINISYSLGKSINSVVYNYAGHSLIQPSTGNTLYYFGEFEVKNKNANVWNLDFHSLVGSSGESSPTSAIPNMSYKVEKGAILGNVEIMTLGTYSEPIVQYGITNAVGILNINSENVTYIKPSNNVQPGQYLIFTEVDEDERLINTFDNTNYGVTFNPISSPDPVYSSVSNNENKTPYKYKIMSYFKESDYNPIAYSGDAKIGFAYISSGSYQYNQMTLITAENQSFILDNTIYNVVIDQQIVLSSNYNPDILLRGYYEQGAGKRWEYYRMAIFDRNGVLLQDTDNIYDGDFSQYFWGLRPNINTTNINYALLIVEDEFGKIYTAGVKLNIYPTSSTAARYQLNNIRYNYNLQSVDIDLGVESDGYTLYRKELNSVKGIEIVDRIASGASDDRPWTVRDYNITNNRKYTYYINQDGSNNKLTPLGIGDIFTGGKCWSIAELYPMDLPIDMENSLTIKKKYVVDENNVWLFKYNGEFGSQTQNIAKSEQGTLGKYPRMGQGMRNNQTGSVSCLLGSEIIPGQQEENTSIIKGYQERLRSARYNDAGIPTRTLTSSNSAIDMLNAWRSFVQSKNPKLLKDVKGQSWIVQITSNQNTPMSHVQGQPDSISFSWTQIGDTKDMIITGNINRSLTSDY